MKVTSATADGASVEIVRDGTRSIQFITWQQLRAAAQQEEAELADVYRGLLRTAQRHLEQTMRASAYKRLGGCAHRGHLANVKERGYAGAVARHPFTDENPKAHGCVSQMDQCLVCGAIRWRNVNGPYQELGVWDVDEAKLMDHVKELGR